jgi:hypothetical protein
MATVIQVATETDLRNAIFEVSDDFVRNGLARGGPYTISITGDMLLGQSLPMIRGDAINAITINGNGHTIDANYAGRVFFVESGKVAINHVTIAHALAEGGNGGAGPCVRQRGRCGLLLVSCVPWVTHVASGKNEAALVVSHGEDEGLVDD